ncbi:uncharacterized protein L203_101759 [Cryptococcus depauperatus CBS 7841]|uniref:Uncharacterized protein n=1 Tax=Cryptococcus depauperatus CBS 7841 TaxID=1295531 RepID=A0A1E3HP31_9TREE|nr:hypothetical protein L203_06189 [Cryptococcus depauperatus CBS 7841]
MSPVNIRRASSSIAKTPMAFSRASSSQAQTFFDPPKKGNGRTLPISTLRSLVSLHHSSAGFLQSPTDLPAGFENAFRYTKPPQFKSYKDFREEVNKLQDLHPPGGMENLVEKPVKNSYRSQGSSKDVYTGVQRAFKAQNNGYFVDSLNAGVPKDKRNLTERQIRVREAVYGIWERGGKGMNRTAPGLDGILEYLEAKGKSVREYAKEWENRSDGSTQDKV